VPEGERAESDDDLLAWIALQARETSVEEGIAGKLREVFSDRSEDRPRHWRVTDLVNPAAAFHSRTHPEVTEDEAIQGRLDYGSYVHGIAPAWFRQLPNYVSAEGPVDGVNGGFPNVRGKIDFRIGDTIIELKTTRHALTSTQDVCRLLPQSLEQLLLYVLMTNRERFHHKLVYYHESPSGNFTVFDVFLKQPGPAKQFFKARLAALDYAVKTKDPTKLGRCRYLDVGCSFKTAGVCPCETLEPSSIEPLIKTLELSRDIETEVKLAEAEGKSSKKSEGSIGLWDLFTPRQLIARSLDADADLGEITDENYVRRRSQETALVFSELSAGRFDLILPTGEEAQTPIRGRGLSIRVLQSKDGRPVEVELPILVRVTNGSPPSDPRELLDVYKAQLGALCAIRGSPTGLVNLTFVSRGGAMQCYVLRFSNLKEIRNRLARRWILIQSAARKKTVEGLAKCPSFVQRNCGSSCLCREGSKS
jgi:hypothetical protein